MSKQRMFPGVRGRRPDNKASKQKEAGERQALYNNLTLQEKLERLPAGHCNKQRAKLMKANAHG
jgi:hypothetical protein